MGWRDIVSNAQWITGVAMREMPDAVDRALAVGAVPPLTYVGAGMTAIVLCDARGHAFKVSRRAASDGMIFDEAEWLRDAARTPGVREHVATFIRFHPSYVIERACPMPTEEYRRVDEHALFDLHYDAIGKRMLARGWTAPEYKRDSYVITDRGPILVDASLAQRIGKNLLRHTVDLIRGRKVELNPYETPSHYAFLVQREIGEKTITEAAAAPVLRALALLEAHGNRWS
jgi:hypothetical protein